MCKNAFLNYFSSRLHFPSKNWWCLFLFLLAGPLSCVHTPQKPDHSAYLDKLIDSANCIVDHHNLKGALQYFNTRYNQLNGPGIGDRLKKYDFERAATYKIAKIDNNRTIYTQSLTYADSMLNLIRDNHLENIYKYDYAVAHFAKGDVLFETGKYEEAYTSYYKGKLLSDQLKDQCSRAFFEDRFALLCYREHKFKQAAPLFLDAYRDNLNCKLDFIAFAAAQGALNNAGLSYQHQNNIDSALNCFQQALTYLDHNAPRFASHNRFVNDAYGVTYGNIGLAYQEKRNVKLAENFFKKSILLNSREGNELRHTQLIELKLAQIYFDTNRLNELDKILGDTRMSLDSLPNGLAELEWQKLKWHYLLAVNEPQNANKYLFKYLKLKDSVDANERKIAVADASSSFRHLQQNYELALLKKQNELNTLYLVYSIGFGLFALVAIFQIWRNWLISKKRNVKLTALHQKALEQNQTLQRTLSALEESYEENTSILEVVAHDLRNPIGAIVNLTGIILESENIFY